MQTRCWCADCKAAGPLSTAEPTLVSSTSGSLLRQCHKPCCGLALRLQVTARSAGMHARAMLVGVVALAAVAAPATADPASSQQRQPHVSSLLQHAMQAAAAMADMGLTVRHAAGQLQAGTPTPRPGPPAQAPAALPEPWEG